MVQRYIMWSLSLVVVTMATVTLAVIIGLNDPRYPDDIVDPKVECVEDGVFPHPRNCTWYYRCVDKITVGFYSTYYFHCEGGTMFSDELDQCLTSDLVRPPCGSYLGPSLVSPPGPLTPQPGPLVNQTGSSTPQPGPTVNQTGSSTTQPRPPCRFDDTVCEKYEVCVPNRITLELCSACFVSTTRVNASEFCSGGNQVLDRNKSICVSPPAASSMCPATSGPTIIPDIRTIQCSDEDLRPMETWILNEHCTDFVLCESNTFKGVRTLCKGYFECRRAVDGSWFTELMTCDEGQMFNYDEYICVPKPSVSELCLI